MASDYQRAALRAAAAARRPARRPRARRRPRCAPRAILPPGPSAPPRDCALQDDRPTTSHPVHFGRAQARTTARCASTSAGTASTSSRAARRAACGARRSTRSRRSTPSRRRRPPPTWRTEPAHARAGGASARRISRRSSSSTGRSWAGHDDDRAACDLGCLGMCPRYDVCVCGGVERGA